MKVTIEIGDGGHLNLRVGTTLIGWIDGLSVIADTGAPRVSVQLSTQTNVAAKAEIARFKHLLQTNPHVTLLGPQDTLPSGMLAVADD